MGEKKLEEEKVAPNWLAIRRNTGHIILVIVLHYSYLYLFPKELDSSPFVTCLAFTLCCWQMVLWTSCALFYWLDTHPLAARKLGFKRLPTPPGHIEPVWRAQMMVALRNMLLAILLTAFIGNILNQSNGRFSYQGSTDSSSLLSLVRRGQKLFQRADDENLFRTVTWFFLYVSIADILFYSGHLLMHRWKNSWLHHTHALHHSSSGLCAISGYYMTTVDFLVEHFPLFVAYYLFIECGPAWSVGICVGTLNLLTTHSGWDHPWFPDPLPHYLHHRKQKKNFGIFLDYALGTATGAKEEEEVRQCEQ